MILDLEVPPELEEKATERKGALRIRRISLFKVGLLILLCTILILAFIYYNLRNSGEGGLIVEVPLIFSETLELPESYLIVINSTRMSITRSTCLDDTLYPSSELQDACWRRMALDSRLPKFCEHVSDASLKAECKAEARELIMDSFSNGR